LLFSFSPLVFTHLYGAFVCLFYTHFILLFPPP
jgi:hypothetical protein